MECGTTPLCYGVRRHDAALVFLNRIEQSKAASCRRTPNIASGAPFPDNMIVRWRWLAAADQLNGPAA
jgi:hypothetical protein